MSLPLRTCPACRQDVDFILDHSRLRCPICHTEFPRDQSSPDLPAAAASTGQRVSKGIGVVLLVLLGLPALWLALAFIGCALGAGRAGH